MLGLGGTLAMLWATFWLVDLGPRTVILVLEASVGLGGGWDVKDGKGFALVGWELPAASADI